MARISLVMLTMLISAASLAEDIPTKVSTQWLSWPVTGYPFGGPDPGIVIPEAKNRFEADVRKDVIIGLRSDGTVVWKYIKDPEEQPITLPFQLPMDSAH